MSQPTPERLVGTELSAEHPYDQVWNQIESAAAERDLDPQAAYQIYEDYLVAHQLDPTVYLSMAITSGGFARDQQLDIGQVIDRNSQFGQLARQALLDQHPELSTSDIILPSELGKVKGWSQADYLLFWFHTIAGLTAESTEQVSLEVAGDLQRPGFTDKSLSSDQKWNDYAGLTDAYLNSLRRLGQTAGRCPQPSNIQAMIMILDGNMSLGGRAEARLCRGIGLPPQFQFLDTNTVESRPALQSSTQVLHDLGAQALGLSINPTGLRFEGVGRGEVKTDLAVMLGARKTNLSNALFAARYYRGHPKARPARHAGHTPITTESAQPKASNEALWRHYYG